MNARSEFGGGGCRALPRGVARVLGALLMVGVGVVGGGGRVAYGAAVPSAVVSTSSALTPDPVFYGNLTEAQRAEITQWGRAYWDRLGTTTTVANSSFTFSSEAMNSPLFNPFYGPRQTLINLGQIDEGDCMKQLVENPGTDAKSEAKRGAIKDALLDFKFKTDTVKDPAGTTKHVIKILDASTVAELVTYVEGEKLVSEKLPLDEVLAKAGASPELAGALSDESVNALLVLTSQAPTLVAAAKGVNESEAMLSGRATKANAVAAAVEALLSQVGSGVNAVERMDALFGVYGQLPLVYVALSDCAVLVDATTGVVTTPVKLGKPLDASGLLALHAEVSAPYAHQIVTAAMGCKVVVAKSWQNTPPTRLVPVIVPAVPATPAVPAVPAGGSGGYTCFLVNRMLCVCERFPLFTNPPGGTFAPTEVKTRCEYSGPLCMPPGSQVCASATPLPQYPSGDPGSAPGANQGCTLVCKTWYYY